MNVSGDVECSGGLEAVQMFYRFSAHRKGVSQINHELSIDQRTETLKNVQHIKLKHARMGVYGAQKEAATADERPGSLKRK